jgi:pimeloyl-ACP methyl ester carboxylesterase
MEQSVFQKSEVGATTATPITALAIVHDAPAVRCHLTSRFTKSPDSLNGAPKQIAQRVAPATAGRFQIDLFADDGRSDTARWRPKQFSMFLTRTLLVSAWLLVFTERGVLPSAAADAPQIKQVGVNGIEITYQEQGKGAPVVFVHGNPGDHRTWDGERDEIAEGHRFIAVDLRYFGTAPWPDDGSKFSIATHAEDLASLIHALNAGPVTLVGWSYGGAVALVATVQHPELVSGLFLYEPGLATFVSDPADAKAAADDRKDMLAPVIAAAKAGDLTGAARRVPDQVTGVPGTFDSLPPIVQASLLDNARVFAVAFTAPPPPQITCQQLGQINVPVTIARGELTRVFYRIAADTANRCILGSRLIIVPSARHAWPAQQPADFDKELLKFLKH